VNIISEQWCNFPKWQCQWLFSNGLKSIKVNIIFPGQHYPQIWISLNYSGQFWRLECGTDSHLKHL
jgi:hypothetical protein